MPDAAGLAWAMVQRFMQDESGVTLRDDPMTKTIAFLNSMPKLS